MNALSSFAPDSEGGREEADAEDETQDDADEALSSFPWPPRHPPPPLFPRNSRALSEPPTSLVAGEMDMAELGLSDGEGCERRSESWKGEKQTNFYVLPTSFCLASGEKYCLEYNVADCSFILFS